MRDLELLVDGQLPDRAGLERPEPVGELLDVVHVRARHREHLADDGHREREREAAHEVDRAVGREPVDELVRDRLDARLERGDAPRREGLVDEAPIARVVGRVELDHAREALVAGVEDGLDLRGELGERLDADAAPGGVAPVVHEHADDVLVARDDPAVHAIAPEHRRLAAELLVDRERVGAEDLGARVVATLGGAAVATRGERAVGVRRPLPRLRGSSSRSSPSSSRRTGACGEIPERRGHDQAREHGSVVRPRRRYRRLPSIVHVDGASSDTALCGPHQALAPTVSLTRMRVVVRTVMPR